MQGAASATIQNRRCERKRPETSDRADGANDERETRPFPSSTGPAPRSGRVAIGSGRFSRFRLFLKNTFALDGVSKRFVRMVAEAILGVETALLARFGVARVVT